MPNSRTALLALCFACATPPAPHPERARSPRISAGFSSAESAAPIHGRLLLALAPRKPDETAPALAPIEAVTDEDDTAQLFGQDVTLAPGMRVELDDDAAGYPLRTLAELPPGDYFAQAVLHRYETFHLEDGRVLELPPDRGEGQDWKSAPGNLVSAPVPVHIDADSSISLDLNRKLPALTPEPDTRYVRHIRFQSERLSRFWGQPVYLGAVVLLPEGYESHPEAHYPLVIEHGHFQHGVDGFREAPPDEKLPPVDMKRLVAECPNGHEKLECEKHGLQRLEQEHDHAFYQRWIGPDFPRVIVVSIQHANPYYDDSYAVNSANLGPYGDAITYELIPYIEKTYRGLGPWARALMGGSTGGWESLAAQIFYPAQYNGAVANCPDPIDFHNYEAIDIYGDENAYYDSGPLRRTARPASRDYLGHIRSTVEQEMRHEAALGIHSRSGQQWAAWEAVFSPAGADGYPRPIWDVRTGDIDRETANYWREHFDLTHIVQRDWSRLEPLLRGKLAINVGLSDNYFLNGAVYRMEDALKQLSPASDAKFDYGARDEHCWSGDHTQPNVVSRMTYRERFIPRFVAHWLASAPPGADVKSWRY